MTGTGDGGKVDSTMALAQTVTRPLITLLLVATFCYGFMAGKVTGETFVIVVTSAVSYWFAQRTQEHRMSDRDGDAQPSASASPPPGGGTATASATSAPNPKPKR
jgi:hypothetical protein